MKEVKRRAPIKHSETEVTLQGRLSYCHLDKPWAGAEGNTPKYSVSLIIPKTHTDTIEAAKAAIEAAIKKGTTSLWRGKRPNVKASNFKYPLKDGDVERPDDEAYRGCMYIGCNSNKPVPVCNKIAEPINPEEAYSGCWGKVKIGFFPFAQGSNGVSAGLNVVMKTDDDERLGGGVATAADMIGPEEEEDDDDIF